VSSVKVWDFWADKYEGLWVQKYSLSPTRRDIIREIKKLIKPDGAYHILDMGCGIGQLISELQVEFKDWDIRYTGVDISSKMIKIASENDEVSTYCNCSVDDFSAASNHFDIIVCSHSFPYYPNKEAAMDKFFNLLKGEGHLFLAQASANSVYDNIAMFFVKFTTGSAKYLSIKKIQAIAENKFNLIKLHKIKDKYYMPSICLFVLKKDGGINESFTNTSKTR
jgi:2-polyprenyl-3-methyl-5-hydroxy-6-metoxy-1,4-benzoquinol methylase